MNVGQILTTLLPGDRDSEELLRRFGDASPLCSVEYGRAVHALGREVWIVGTESESSQGQVTLGVLKKGRLSVELEFPSLPTIAQDARFWRVVDSLCNRAGVTDIVAASFGSVPFELPTLRGEVTRRMRNEFLIQLAGPDPAVLLGSNHKRNVKKSERAGVVIRRTRENLDWVTDHVVLIQRSMQRRLARGESVPISEDAELYRALVRNGAAELFQAVLGTEVLSSVLVLSSPRTGYYQSAGTSPEGMSVGASHFLISEIAAILKREGAETFNLGGAPEGSSLARFKLGFGARAVALPAATCYVGPSWKKKLRTAIRLIRSDRRKLVRILTGSSTRLLVFRAETEGAASPAAPIPGARLAPLNEEQLAALTCPKDDPDFRNRQLERMRRFGRSYAYGVNVGGVIAHISWLLPPAAVVIDVPSILSLREGEAEIAGCETIGEFRGKGLFGFAIQQLAIVAREQGIRRVYLKTLATNHASQRGIQRAGLNPIGSIRLTHPPLIPSITIVRRASTAGSG